MTEEERIEGRKYAAWLNLFIGMYNIYLVSIDYNIFNIVIGIWIVMTLLCYWFGVFMSNEQRDWN